MSPVSKKSRTSLQPGGFQPVGFIDDHQFEAQRRFAGQLGGDVRAQQPGRCHRPGRGSG